MRLFVSLITYQMDGINLERVQYLLLIHEQKLSMLNSVSYSDGKGSVSVTYA